MKLHKLCLLSITLLLPFFVLAQDAQSVQSLQDAQDTQSVQAQEAQETNKTDKKGRKQGFWIKQDTSRNLCYEGLFKDDRPQGLFTYTDQEGQLVCKAFYFRDGYASYNLYYYPDGKLLSEGYYLDKQKDSIWKYYRQNGKCIKEEHYKNGQLNGLAKLYDINENIIEIMPWFRGLRNGAWWRSESGGYQSGNYFLNLSQGPYYTYYSDSAKYIVGNYNKGDKDGLWSFYLPSPSNTLYKEDIYKDNLLKERRIYLKIQGELIRISTDSIVAVFADASGKGELHTNSGNCLHADETFETVCDIISLEHFFYANEKVFVSYQFIEDITSDEGMNKLKMKVNLPIPIYVDEEGEKTIKNLWNKDGVEAEETE